MNGKENVVVTTVIGDKYKDMYNKTFRASQERFVRKINTDFIFIEKDIEKSPNHSHPSWQKLLMFRHPEISKYKRVFFLDADILVTRHAKNPFEIVDQSFSWGMAKNNPHLTSEAIDGDLELYKYCPVEHRPDFMLNAGVFLIDKSCEPVLEHIFYTYKEQPCYDNGPFSYHLLTGPKGMILPSEFNLVVFNYIKAYGCSLSSILRMYREASLLHFVASKWRSVFYFLRWFDTTESYLLKKIVMYFDNKRYDFLTEKFFMLWERLWGIYNYRIKKTISKLFA